MTANHILLGFTFGMSVSVISWMVGMILNAILAKTGYYQKLSNLNFIESKALNNKIGINHFRWIVKNTFFKFFNPKLKLESKGLDLIAIRHEMTLAEISHLIGFLVVAMVAIYFSFRVSLTYGLTMMVPNILLNLYPSLLQQENKRRLDKLIVRRNGG